MSAGKSYKRWVFKHPTGDPMRAEWTEHPGADPSEDARFRGCVRRKDGVRFNRMVQRSNPLWELSDGVVVDGEMTRISLNEGDTCNTGCKTAASPRWACGCGGCRGKNHGMERDIHLGEHNPTKGDELG